MKKRNLVLQVGTLASFFVLGTFAWAGNDGSEKKIIDPLFKGAKPAGEQANRDVKAKPAGEKGIIDPLFKGAKPAGAQANSGVKAKPAGEKGIIDPLFKGAAPSGKTAKPAGEKGIIDPLFKNAKPAGEKKDDKAKIEVKAAQTK